MEAASQSTSREELSCNCCIRGYHVYMEVWEATIGEVLHCEPQANNTKDQYAVAVCRLTDKLIVGHIPKIMSRICWLFLKKPNCTISCCVTGGHQYSHDLSQGGLQIPCSLKFLGPLHEINKVYVLLTALQNNKDSICTDVRLMEE